MSSTVSIWFVFAQQNYIQYKCATQQKPD